MTEEFSSYEATLLSALGDSNPMLVLMDTLNAFHDLIDDTDQTSLKTGPESDWSVRDVIAHMVDVDLVWGVRIRLILAQDQPALIGFDQDAWVKRFGSLEQDPVRMFEQFRVLREANLLVLESVTPEELEREGVHSDWGNLSVDQILRMMAGHSAMHLKQAHEILDAVGRSAL